jgi:hypothetical protein
MLMVGDENDFVELRQLIQELREKLVLCSEHDKQTFSKSILAAYYLGKKHDRPSLRLIRKNVLKN